MTTPDLTRDPERDAALSAALRGAMGDVPEPDWDRLRSSVASRAEMPLARRRREARPRPWTRARSLLPLAAAAGIAGLAVSLATLRPADPPPLTDADRRMVEQIVDAQLPDVDPLLTGEAASDALIEAMVDS
jgi:hypothetical protein